MVYQSAKHLSAILSENTVFHIVITGHDEKTGFVGFSWHNEHPYRWCIGKSYRPPVIRHVGAIEFRFYDYVANRNDWIYFFAAKQVMAREGLLKS